MLPYWILFAAWAIGALQYRAREIAKRSPLFTILVGATALMVGMRWEVGGDWGAYQRIYESDAALKFSQLFGVGDPAYTLLNWVSAQLDGGIRFVNLVCAAIFGWGLCRFAKRQPNPWLAVLIGVPYLVIVVAMGYVRQATAIGIMMAGLAALSASENPSLFRFAIYTAAAATFHKSAVVVLPMVALAFARKNVLITVAGSIFFIVLYYLFLNNSADQLLANYVQGDYDSQGALIRILMNIPAALIVVVLKPKLNYSPIEHQIWTNFSWISIVVLAGIFIAPSTSGLDRISLFLIPLQLTVLSRLTTAEIGGRRLALALISYLAAIQLVWLVYANNSYFWIPYRFIAPQFEETT